MNDASSLPSEPYLRDAGRLGRRRYDVLVIGGGINGAGIARDLSLRGLRVALVEKGDFASGTSSASTKLIHGGLRYLEQFDLRLVFEACRERRILQSIAPHLVRPMPFMIPVYRGGARSLTTIRAGLTLYDLLALMHNTRPHHIISAQEGVRREPALRAEGLTGVALYWDCRMDDARLCLENIIAAAEGGADVFNYMETTALLKRSGRLTGARLLDRESGGELEVEAEIVINATGPWLDRLRALDDGSVTPMLRPTRGSHILVPRIHQGDAALYLSAGRDDRLFFVIPWGELSLIGTTDVDYPGDPDRVVPPRADIDYLLEETAAHLKGAAPRREDVVAAFAGIRPLIAEKDSPASRVTREHRIVTASSGLISVGGGKYTTYRAVAQEVAAEACRQLGRGAGRSLTHRIPLPGGATGNFTDYLRRRLPELTRRHGLPPETLEPLVRQYGSRIGRLLELARREPDLLKPVVPGSPLLAVQVAYAADCEFARTPEDVLRRRSPLALQKGRGLAELEGVADILAPRLNASRELYESWLRDYRARHSMP